MPVGGAAGEHPVGASDAAGGHGNRKGGSCGAGAAEGVSSVAAAMIPARPTPPMTAPARRSRMPRPRRMMASTGATRRFHHLEQPADALPQFPVAWSGHRSSPSPRTGLSRSLARARESWLRTVPGEQPSAAAICASVRSSQ